MLYIGIDPDVVKSGVAIMQEGEYTNLFSISFPELTELMQLHGSNDEVLFVVEDVNANKPTFRKKSADKEAAKHKISQDVGMVKGVARIIVDMLNHHKCNYEMVRPLKGQLKAAKNKPEYFKRLTGWEGRSNKDTRDAAMLIYKYMPR